MKFVTDLHLHSKYSRAVSQQMVLLQMAKWAGLKGISVLATGDFTHPFWFDRLKSELVEAENGLYKLRKTKETEFTPGVSLDAASYTPGVLHSAADVYFLLSCEISSIYSQGGKVRRIHSLVFFSSLADVEAFNTQLLKHGAHLRSDGRPIVGISAHDLAEMAFSVSDKALFIPAHAWTPWFSVFGAFSGFDSISECFGDLASKIYAIETGLSSDPAMNWQIGELENRAILSFSDAHSLEKMGREATVFEAEEISYESIYKAIARGPVSSFPPVSARSRVSSKRGQKNSVDLRAVGSPSTTATPRIAFTIEFYPEEGKYHYSGHRNCDFSISPEEMDTKGEVCPVCSRPMTIGVMQRVRDLKTSDLRLITEEVNGVRWTRDVEGKRPPYVSMVPLSEILAQCLDVAVGTKKVSDYYFNLVNTFGSEFNVLLKAREEDLQKVTLPKIAEAISKVRSGKIHVEPGYDGKFGIVKIFGKAHEKDEAYQEATGASSDQLNLF